MPLNAAAPSVPQMRSPKSALLCVTRPRAAPEGHSVACARVMAGTADKWKQTQSNNLRSAEGTSLLPPSQLKMSNSSLPPHVPHSIPCAPRDISLSQVSLASNSPKTWGKISSGELALQ